MAARSPRRKQLLRTPIRSKMDVYLTVGKMRHDYETKLDRFARHAKARQSRSGVELQAFVRALRAIPTRFVSRFYSQRLLLILGQSCTRWRHFSASEAERAWLSKHQMASKYGGWWTCVSALQDDNSELVDILAFRGATSIFTQRRLSLATPGCIGEFERAFYEANRNRDAVHRGLRREFTFSLLMWFRALFNCKNAFNGVVETCSVRNEKAARRPDLHAFKASPAVFPTKCFGKTSSASWISINAF